MDTLVQPPAGARRSDLAWFAFDNSYARLPERFYARQQPAGFPAPQLVMLNAGLAIDLGADPQRLASAEGAQVLVGNTLPAGAEPLAMAYAGHQFGNWVGQLGDGRAILLGEVVDRSGVRRDIQLKGAGRTPFSRMGDGRAVLGPVLREYIVSEAMRALGVPTTRSLAALSTGERIVRQGPEPGALLVRVASSHVRVGTFEYFSGRGDLEGLQVLADYVIARHYPQAAAAGQPYQALLESVMERTAALVAAWQHVGFIHGVMNTDNMSIAGETIDYGPCAFVDSYHPGTVYSSIDAQGRYAFGNQPWIAQWNLARLAQSLLPLLAAQQEEAIAMAQAAIDGWPDRFARHWSEGLRRKLGLQTREDGDGALGEDLLARMARQGADFTLTFRRLAHALEGPSGEQSLRALFAQAADLEPWLERWRARLEREPGDAAERRERMLSANPAYIPRNHLIEEALRAASRRGDFGPVEELTRVLATPYVEQGGRERYGAPPRPEEVVHETFCGT